MSTGRAAGRKALLDDSLTVISGWGAPAFPSDPVPAPAPALPIAANLDLDERINARLDRGEQVLHLGFGESRLPLHPGLVRRLRAGAGLAEYGPVAGRESARAAVAGYFTRRGLPTGADDVILAPGSKPLLLAAMAAIPGDVVLPQPAWVTYAPQARLLGRLVVPVPIPAQVGGVPDPQRLTTALAAARARGADPRMLVLTSPDNPTGTTATPQQVRAVAELAEREDLIILADEIYRDLLFPGAPAYLSAAEVVGHRAVVFTGLSKSLSLGGWRIGAARFPADAPGRALRGRVLGAASQIWSNAPGPMQAVAEYAFAEPPEVVAHREAGARLHAIVTRSVHRALADHGADVRPPTGGFYVYPDLSVVADELADLGVHGSADLEALLLDRFGIAVLGGHHFGDDPRALRFRAATSLLHGRTDATRRAALQAADPLALDHIAAAVARLGELIPGILAMAGRPGGRGKRDSQGRHV